MQNNNNSILFIEFGVDILFVYVFDLTFSVSFLVPDFVYIYTSKLNVTILILPHTHVNESQYWHRHIHIHMRIKQTRPTISYNVKYHSIGNMHAQNKWNVTFWPVRPLLTSFSFLHFNSNKYYVYVFFFFNYKKDPNSKNVHTHLDEDKIASN